MDPDVSVIVPAKNTDEDSVESISRLNSLDYSATFEVLLQNENGLNAARNQGVINANANKIAFIDDDSLVEPGFIDAVDKALNKYKIVSGRITNTAPSYISRYVSHYDRGNNVKKITNLIGCNMAVRRDVFKAIGLFDESFHYGHGESDFSNRARKTYSIWYWPDMQQRHPYAEGMSDLWNKGYRHGVADIYLWAKNDKSIPIKLFKNLVHPGGYRRNSVKSTIAWSGMKLMRHRGRFVGILNNEHKKNAVVPTIDSFE